MRVTIDVIKLTMQKPNWRMRWLVASYLLRERAGQPGRSLVHISPTDLIWLDGNAVFSFTSDALRPCVQLDKLHQARHARGSCQAAAAAAVREATCTDQDTGPDGRIEAALQFIESRYQHGSARPVKARKR